MRIERNRIRIGAVANREASTRGGDPHQGPTALPRVRYPPEIRPTRDAPQTTVSRAMVDGVAVVGES